jgi:hypothetical protein
MKLSAGKFGGKDSEVVFDEEKQPEFFLECPMLLQQITAL